MRWKAQRRRLREARGLAETARRRTVRQRNLLTGQSARTRKRRHWRRKARGSERLLDADRRESRAGAEMAQVTMLEGIRQALFEEMDRDPSVVALGEDIGVYGGAFKVTEGLLAKFGPERVIDAPISETAIVGAACGMGYLGLRPVRKCSSLISSPAASIR